ncbi:hypothetical protein Bca4012_079872 [Brassica carinata]|uniref:Uncharacterized protein n=1 Tax=Brassica carinata TaxID=52824 RepID=A0A8X7U5N0_BRACI|nr:hypothetical protein Bca52824_071070 [Brassica carinata]
MYLSKLAHLQLSADSCIFSHHCSALILPEISFLQASQSVSILIQHEDFLATAHLNLLPKLHLNSLSSYNQSPSMNQT